MTTVLKPGESFPDNAETLLLESNSKELYARPTAGGNAQGGDATGGSSDAPPGVVPSNPIMGGIQGAPPDGDLMSAYSSDSYPAANAGAPTTQGGTQAGPDMFHGATQVVPDSGDRPSGGKTAASGGGTVGDSGPQGGPFQADPNT